MEAPRCLRPAYHFTPATGRVGDPNGLCWYDGLYHLFFLHFWKWPDDTGQSSWGHLVSEDMIRWREAPTAFFPGEAYDSQSCWSGCFRMIEGVPTIFYSGVGEDGVSACLATSEDMYRWSKSGANPLMTPEQMRANWDPCVWREGDTYLMLTGGKRGAELFESKDLRSWSFLHPLLAEDPRRGLTKWDCPHLFKLGAKHVLIVYAHPMRQSIYFVGRYEERRFHVEGRGNLDVGVNVGGAFSAAHPSYGDPHGRTVLVGMMQERVRMRKPCRSVVGRGLSRCRAFSRSAMMTGYALIRLQRLSRCAVGIGNSPTSDLRPIRRINSRGFPGRASKLRR